MTIKLALVDHLLYVYNSGTIVVFDDPEAEKKYLTLDQLGFVLKHLSEQLPGISVRQDCKEVKLVNVTCFCIASVIAKRTFDDEELKSGTPNLVVVPSGL